MRLELGSLSFAANLTVRTAIYAAIIITIQFFQLGDVIVRLLAIRLMRSSGYLSSIPLYSRF
jgi:hypothetical protein